MNYLVQLIGFAGSATAALSAQFQNRNKMLLCQFMSCILWVAHYALLGALTGAVGSVLSIIRVLLFSSEKKWACHPSCLILILSLCIANTALTWSGIESLLAGLASCFTTMALWSRDMKYTRCWLLLDSPCWFFYDLMIGSISGMVVEALAFGSYLLAIFRLDLKKKT